MSDVFEGKSDQIKKYQQPWYINLKNQILNTLKLFKEDRTGMAGLAILLGLVLMTAIAIPYKGHERLTGGDEPIYAKPIWLAPFDSSKFKFTQSLINTNFDKQNEFRIKTVGSSKINSQYTIGDEGTTITFSEKNSSQPIPEDSIPSSKSVVLTKELRWDKRAPNGLALSYSFKYDLSGKWNMSQFSQAPVYNISTAVYIDAGGFTSTEAFVNYLNSRPNIDLSDKDWDKFGIYLKTKQRMLGLFSSRTTTNPDKGRIELMNIFQVASRVQLKYVTTFNIIQSSIANRTSGQVSLTHQEGLIEAQGYYSGLMGTIGGANGGADLFSLIGQGVKNSLMLGLVTTFVSLGIGIPLGIASGWYGGGFDEAVMRVVDFLLVMPTLPLMIVLVSVFNKTGIPPIWGVSVTISLLAWPNTSRMLRSQVLSVKESPFIEAAQASGVPDRSIMGHHILPNVMGLVIYNIVSSVQFAILAAAGLSFLGMGPSWVSFGNILQQASGILFGQGQQVVQGGEAIRGAQGAASVWWFLLFPGLILALFGTSLIFIGMTIQNHVQRLGEGE